jgi:hypothetical protein
MMALAAPSAVVAGTGTWVLRTREEKQYPLIGPATYEEAISRIEAAEKETHNEGV